MTIELLYVPDCPNYAPARQAVEEVLHAIGIEMSISELEIADLDRAREVGFLGSPSIRVNGTDVEPDAAAGCCGISCRMYFAEGRFQGIPAREQIRQAIEAARSKEDRK